MELMNPEERQEADMRLMNILRWLVQKQGLKSNGGIRSPSGDPGRCKKNIYIQLVIKKIQKNPLHTIVTQSLQISTI